jgi:hypothetical protein
VRETSNQLRDASAKHLRFELVALTSTHAGVREVRPDEKIGKLIVVDFSDISRRVSAKLYECESKAKDDYQRTRLGTEAVTIALLAILEELQEIHETIKDVAHALRPLRGRC